MSEQRQRRPATKRGPKSSNPKTSASAAAIAPEPAADQGAGDYIEALFFALYDEESDRRSEKLLEGLASGKPSASLPKAQIIPFPKARH